MVKLVYGTQQQVKFSDLNEYYFTLGFLANSRNAELKWENNEDQGAWGSEGRIHCLVPEKHFPQCFRFTAGRGNVYARINCNDFVGTLVTEHNFCYNQKKQNLERILETIPEKYRDVFFEGLGRTVAGNIPYKERTNQSITKRTDNSKVGIVQPIKPPQPEPPKPVKLVDVKVGELISHKAFGVGCIYEVDNQYIRIDFATCGKKSFVNPQAFESGFLKKLN